MNRIPAKDRSKVLKEAVQKGLKLLIWDIETSHMLVRTFYIGQKVFIQHTQIKVPSKVISIQYMFEGDKKAQYLQWKRIDKRYHDVRDFDDASMLAKFVHDVYDKADIIVTQNGDAFDWKTINDRLKTLQLPLLVPKPSLDILKLSRQSFRSASHTLDYRSKQQGLGGKIKMIDDDWVDIEERGIPVAKKMAPYGCNDTEETRALMWQELSYYKTIPVNVEQTILKYTKPYLIGMPKPLKPFCPDCGKHKQRSKYNIVVAKNHIYCNYCQQRFKR